MNSIFNELDHRQSEVVRYNLFSTLQKQNLASHVFNVTRIATRIAKQWLGADDATLLAVYEWAHNHENTESLSGDFPAMVKGYFDEHAFEADHAFLLPAVTRPEKSSLVYQIVKLADIMDIYYFFCVERALGNRHVSKHLVVSAQRLRNFAATHFGEELFELLNLWMIDVAEPKSDTFIQIKWSEER